MTTDRLNVIGLISGGKDSFFSLLHCIEHGHRIVALANLYPAAEQGNLPIETQWIDPEAPLESSREPAKGSDGEETDLNSFMYQTVGHEVIPLYAAATGLSLYRRQIHGSAVRHERDYDYAAIASAGADDGEETESMVPLLRSIMERHPEANAVCAGAILSTYQRTRVESIALRLGLTPLAYLWKYPVLPSPTVPVDEAQLLLDMASTTLEARIIKVASAGLDEDHLWLKASSVEGAARVKQALKKFGAGQGAALGEGGEFETLVMDGPRALFRKRIRVPEEGKVIVKEGGGTSWVKLEGAVVEAKDLPKEEAEANVRQPELLDPRFERIFEGLTTLDLWSDAPALPKSTDFPSPAPTSTLKDVELLVSREFHPDKSIRDSSIGAQTSNVMEQALRYLQSRDLEPSQVSNTIILLKDMANFPVVNTEYSKMFNRANPPSRVTISCGNLLSGDSDIVVSLTAPQSSTGRQGLHVQSRSYWAPANIGPYSQAITVLLSTGDGSQNLRTVSIAGQIPLIPATMVLPEVSTTSSQLQIALSLQHLWRIAVDMKVQWWSSAVAYFSTATSDAARQRRAKMVGYAWAEANRPIEEDEDEDAQLDPWDLKHNSEHMTLGNAEDQDPAPLPDWSLLPLRQQNDWKSRLPPVFSVEIDSLPRQAEVEWHAHVGIAGASESAIEMFSLGNLVDGACEAWHMLVREQGTTFLHSTLSYTAPGQESGETALQRLSAAYGESVQALTMSDQADGPATPYLVYMESAGPLDLSGVLHNDSHPGMSVIPCSSLWAADGTKRTALALYRRVLSAS
jgi:diphthine-ammonia ligase